MSSTFAPTILVNLFTRLQLLYPGTQVVYGDPGTDIENDVVSIGMVQSSAQPVNLSPNRPREEQLNVDILFSCFTGGGPDAQWPSTQRAYTYMATLETYLQVTSPIIDTPGVRVAWISSHNLDPGETLSGVEAMGRLASLTATMTVHVRL